MDTPAEPQPAAKGLLNSGYAVSIVRSSTEIETYLGDDDLIYVVLPGSPCQVLIGFFPPAAEKFPELLNTWLRERRKRPEQRE